MNRKMPSPEEQANLLLDWLYLDATMPQTVNLSIHLRDHFSTPLQRAEEVKRLGRPENLGEVYRILGQPIVAYCNKVCLA